MSPPRELVLSDATAVRLRAGCHWLMAIDIALLAITGLLWLHQERLEHTLRELAEGAPALLGIVLALAVYARVRLSPEIDVDFPTAVRERNALFRLLPSLLTDARFSASGDVARVEGVFGGLPLRISVWSEPSRMPSDDAITYTVEFACAWRMEVRRKPDDPKRPARSAADRLDCRGEERRPLDPEQAEALLELLDRHHVDEVVLGVAGLTAKLPASRRTLQGDRQRRALTDLVAAARAFGAAPASTTRVEVTAAARASDVSCPYCRAPIGDPEREVCRSCRTPHHDACMAEHGGCTVAGCRGGPDRRVRAR